MRAAQLSAAASICAVPRWPIRGPARNSTRASISSAAASSVSRSRVCASSIATCTPLWRSAKAQWDRRRDRIVGQLREQQHLALGKGRIAREAKARTPRTVGRTSRQPQRVGGQEATPFVVQVGGQNGVGRHSIEQHRLRVQRKRAQRLRQEPHERRFGIGHADSRDRLDRQPLAARCCKQRGLAIGDETARFVDDGMAEFGACSGFARRAPRAGPSARSPLRWRPAGSRQTQKSAIAASRSHFFRRCTKNIGRM